MEILGIVPARGGSKGIPGKNIRCLKDQPLIGYSFEAAANSKYLSRTVLTTDSEAIAKVGHDYGVEVPFMRPAQFSDDNASANDYITHCLEYLLTTEGYEPDLVVLLQPTCPFRNSEDIDACIELLFDSDADSVVSVTELPTKYHPNWQFTVSDEGLLRPFGESGWESIATARQQLKPTYTRNGAVYAFPYELYQSTKRIYGNKVKAYIMPAERSVNIDDMEDWQAAEQYLSNV
jgi:N-acylneuraminate cytidylyltransferase